MTKVRFYLFMRYEDGKIANVDLSEEEIPLNIFIDNAEELGRPRKTGRTISWESRPTG